jgi:hypothetical protein
MTGHKK